MYVSRGGVIVEALIFFLLGIALYFAPFIVAMVRRKTGRVQVFIVNLFFGWTFIGWVIALVMAFGSDNVTKVMVVQTPPQNKTEERDGDR